MNLSNYEFEIVKATQNISDDVKSLYEKSEDILSRMMELKALAKDEDGISKMPMQTLALTKECVSVLKKIESIIGPSHKLYTLQSAKLYNIVINSSAYWGEMWMYAVRTKKGGTSDEESSSQLAAYKLCMKEMKELSFQELNKSEFEKKCQEMHVEDVIEKPTNPGCMLLLTPLFILNILYFVI